MPRLIAASGYDAVLVSRLERSERRFFHAVALGAVASSLLVGTGLGYGATLAVGPAVGVVLGVVFVLLTLNLFRLLHAGTGYPVHLPVEDIDTWRPGIAPALVFFALGALLSQPLVFLLLRPLLVDAGPGLIARAHAAWDLPQLTAPLVVVLAALVSAPAWLRVVAPNAIRAYERERWIDDRLLVDDAFADAQAIITLLLERAPGFSGRLALHYADPPYNTRPLLFGLDPSLLVRGGVRFVPGRTDEPAVFVDAAPVVDPAPTPTPAPTPEPAPPPEPPPAPPPRSDDAEELIASWDDPSHDDDTAPPAVDFFDIGRLQVKRAREHADVVAPFIARFTGRPEDIVRGLLRAAPDDERVHRLFGDYKTLRSILLQEAGFALDHGFAPILAVITQREVQDVDKRLRAAPRDKRLTGVFAPELARRLLKKKR